MRKNNLIKMKVMKKIYFLETKRMLIEISLKIIIFIVLFLSTWLFFDVLYSILKEQKTFDLLTLFKDNPEAIGSYFFDNLTIFFFETPKIILIVILLLITLTSLFILQLIKKYHIIKNKVISLLKFYQKKI